MIKKTTFRSEFLKRALQLTAFSSALGIALSSHAASFQVIDLSAATLGSANAGTGVSSTANVQYANPAAMAFFDHPELSLSLIGVLPTISYDTTLASRNGTNIIPTSSANSPEQNAILPDIYFVYPINKQIAAGFSITTPYGLKTVYSPDSVARYFATESKIMGFNFNPSISIKAFDNFAVGMGLDVIYFKAELDSAINLNPLIGRDIFIDNQAHDTGIGWNGGLMWKPTSTTDLGLSYHSKIRLDLTGEATFSGMTAAQQLGVGGLGFHDSNASADLTLPDYITLSAKQVINSWFTLLGDITYTDWSVLKTLTIHYSGDLTGHNWSNLSDATQTFDYRNTWRFALGQEYKINSIWTFKTGIAYEQSPVRDQYREPRLPDNNRIWLSAGSNFKFNDKLDLDVGYSHAFIKSGSINNAATNALGTNLLAANYNMSANLIGAQLNYHFNA